MIEPRIAFETLQKLGADFFVGVPDSLLKSFCAYVTDHVNSDRHIIAANEGAAVALACGYHLATGKIPLVYLQNSGLGNTVNPLLSIADREVYSIPMVLLIGWRGEPGVKDEPQHVKQGRVMPAMLDAMEIPHFVVDGSESSLLAFEQAYQRARALNAPVALMVRKDAFAPYKLQRDTPSQTSLTREHAIQCVVAQLDTSTAIVSTTGMASRELFEYRAANQQGHQRDFLTVGGMGHASQIALGMAIASPQRQVVCLDGDGAALMHLGSLAISGRQACRNFKHIVVNNGAHDSVGGQPTVALDIQLGAIAAACGYQVLDRAHSEEEINNQVTKLLATPGPVFLEILVCKGSRKDLGRPTTTPRDNKQALMQFLLD
jgi:phosphonopyruvate decarboxylase